LTVEDDKARAWPCGFSHVFCLAPRFLFCPPRDASPDTEHKIGTALRFPNPGAYAPTDFDAGSNHSALTIGFDPKMLKGRAVYVTGGAFSTQETNSPSSCVAYRRCRDATETQ